MNINSDLSERIVLHADQLAWHASPIQGVERQMLDRNGGEMARATSVVRYAPNTEFMHHTHDGGEEILVLDGRFSDERGDYPAGTYLRNPPGSQHAPFSADGCTLFVKLRQFAQTDSQELWLNTKASDWYPGLVPGLSVMPLHEHDGVSTALVARKFTSWMASFMMSLGSTPREAGYVAPAIVSMPLLLEKRALSFTSR